MRRCARPSLCDLIWCGGGLLSGHVRAAGARKIQHNYGHLPNLHALRGALGETSSVSSYSAAQKRGMNFFRLSAKAMALPVNTALTTYRLDDLNDAWARERLAFANIDVDGHEISLLRGARRIIARDRPLLTTEVTVHDPNARCLELLRLLGQMGYDSYMVEELTGMRAGTPLPAS